MIPLRWIPSGFSKPAPAQLWFKGTLWGTHGRGPHNFGTRGGLRESWESPHFWVPLVWGPLSVPNMAFVCAPAAARRRLRRRPFCSPAHLVPMSKLFLLGLALCASGTDHAPDRSGFMVSGLPKGLNVVVSFQVVY